MKAFLTRITCVLTALATFMSLSTVSFARTYNDMSDITSHVNLKVPSTLGVTHPSGVGYTQSDAYFIMGSSDPALPLTINDQVVATRGSQGSFGVYVKIGEGENLYTFRQGTNTVPVKIVRGVDPQVQKISNVRDMAPSFDCATRSGEIITLSCTAPSGAVVTATLNGQTYPLEQIAPTQEKGVPVVYQTTTTAPQVSGTQNIGRVTYIMTYQNKTASQQSEGSVFITGPDARLVVQAKNTATCLYDSDQMTYFAGEAKIGAVDYVTEIGQACYRLSSGGWIKKDTVTPLTGNVSVKNQVSKTEYESVSGGEVFRLTGTTHPFYQANMENGSAAFRLKNTTDVTKNGQMESKLFSTIKISEEGGDTVLTFVGMSNPKEDLWGFDVSYKNGVTTIYFKYRPRLSTGDKPLSGVTVAVDAGHGGSDPGTLGFPMTNGATEAEINLAAAMAVQKRLESLGATVELLRETETDLTMNDRMIMTRKADADFFISLHTNSAGYEVNGNKISGVEAYYYFGNSKDFASIVAENAADYTGRTARGAKFSNYRVTLNTFCPSVLLEMGYATNPKEYDDLTSKKGIYEIANAVGDSIIETLK